MKLWLSKNSEIPVRVQLVAQISIGIASGDLEVGEKLPSTREVARRFGVHPNTVSAAYRELAQRGLAEFRKGSGVFVATGPNAVEPNLDLDRLVTRFLNDAAVLGFSAAAAADRLAAKLRSRNASGILVVEPNKQLREIIIAEIEAFVGVKVRGAAPTDLANEQLDRLQLTALFDETSRIEPLLPNGKGCVYLKANSAASSLTGKPRPSVSDLIGIASGWTDFLEVARLFLIAADVDPESIVACLTDDEGWQRRLKGVSLIICDAVTAKGLGADDRVQVFPIIAESSLVELAKAIEVGN